VIRTLYIRDYALIDELEINFGEGLNILTGETGAGKSIIIGALNLILGERADTDAVRTGSSKAVAEAHIAVGGDERITRLMAENEIEPSETVILRREIRPGSSRAFINDTPVTISVLKQAGDMLVDLHGQHDHQLLLHEDQHRAMVDGFTQATLALAEYMKAYRQVVAARKDLATFRKREKDLQEKSGLFSYQLRELQAAGLREDELAEMEAEMNLLDNAEELDKQSAIVTGLGTDGEINVIDLLGRIERAVEELGRIQPEFESYLQELHSARVSIEELLRFTERNRTNFEYNPARLEKLRLRQAELARLQKKYAADIPGLIELRDELAKTLSLADNFDLETGKRERELQRQLTDLKRCALTLHEARESIGERLLEAIGEELQKLGMPYARFEVKVEWLKDPDGWLEIDGQTVACEEHGCDSVRFFISTNKGEKLKPLAKTASGGEISRIMLALKAVLAREHSLPVMIFDEIDVGISGQVGHQVGRTMRALSKRCQIIAITHLPQIASQSHHHYRVSKTEENERTVTRIEPLFDKDHIREIARLMSGDLISESSLQSARELVDESKKADVR
jgi:DNA repair protein RecN (Recombination protein N)